jgi:hypothetical protein
VILLRGHELLRYCGDIVGWEVHSGLDTTMIAITMVRLGDLDGAPNQS